MKKGYGDFMIKKNWTGYSIVLLSICLLGFFSCKKAVEETPKPLRIAVASNFMPVMENIKELYLNSLSEVVEVDLINGASGILKQQISQGAPFDLFFSADTLYPFELYQAGFAKQKPQTYAIGKLVLVSNRPIQALDQMCIDSSWSKFGIANPELAPYGAEAQRFINTLACVDDIQQKLVLANNINQLNHFSQNEHVAYALTSANVLYQDELTVFFYPLPDSFGPIQSCMLLDGKQDPHASAKDFLEFVQSKEIQALIVSKGYRM